MALIKKRRVAKILLLIAVEIFFRSPAFSHDECLLSEAKKIISAENTFWEKTDPVNVLTPQGPKPLTYSFDSELQNADLYKKIYKDPELYAKLKAESEKYPIPISNAAKWLGMTEKQFRSFAIRKNAVLIGEKVLLTDIHPSYASELFTILHFNFGESETVVRYETTQKVLHDIPIGGGLDGKKVEVRHLSYETSPKEYKKIISVLHSRFDHPDTHFHLGIPASSMDNPKFLAMSRAMETRGILRLALNDSNPTQKLPYFQSYLGPEGLKNTSTKARGIICSRLNFFGGEVPAHDFELRQWDDVNQGLDEIEIAAELSKNPNRLKILADRPASLHQDIYTQNLFGALDYAGEILSDSSDSKIQSMGKQLRELAREINTAKGPTETDRKKIQEFLEDNSILERLTADQFLVSES